MVARNAYILSGLLHLTTLAFLFLLVQVPTSPSRLLQRYQPVRLIALPGTPGPVAKVEKPVSSPAEKAKLKTKSAKTEAKPVPKTAEKRTAKAKGAAKEKGEPRKSEAVEAGGGGAGPSGVRLEGENFPYPYYLSNIQIKILSNFRPTVKTKVAEELKAVVFFLIERNGRIRDVKLEDKSGHFLFDQEAQRAVLRSNPLPALPPAFGSDRLGVHFEFVGTD